MYGSELESHALFTSNTVHNVRSDLTSTLADIGAFRLHLTARYITCDITDVCGVHQFH